MKPANTIVKLAATLGLLILGISHLHAKASEGGGFTFSCASWENMSDTPIFYLAGKPAKDEDNEARMKRLRQVDVTKMTRSQQYRFKSGRIVHFYHKTTGAQGDAILQEVATVKVPADWSRVLFLFIPGKSAHHHRIFPIRDDRAHAPFGSYQFVNFSKITVSGFIGKERISLQPKESRVVRFRGKTRPLNFGVWSVIDGKRQWLQRNTLTYKPDKQLIYFFHQSQDRRGRIKVESKGIVDFRPPPEAPRDVLSGGEISSPSMMKR